MGDAEALESASRRAATLARAWAERPSPDEPYHWAGPAGNVVLRHVRAAHEGELVYVHVWTGLPTADLDDPILGPAHFKIINPPLIYVESDGSWVEDPLAALCAVITSTSRATAGKGKR